MAKRARTAGAWCALLLSGCWSVVPGYDPLGKAITQRHRERDGRTVLLFYTWGHVPASQISGRWSPLVGLLHGVVSLALAPLSLVLVPVRSLTDAGPDDEEGVLVIEEEEQE
jgi:hypothetical protein